MLKEIVVGNTQVAVEIFGDECSTKIIEQKEVKLHIDGDIHTVAEEILEYFSLKELSEKCHKTISEFCSKLSI